MNKKILTVICQLWKFTFGGMEQSESNGWVSVRPRRRRTSRVIDRQTFIIRINFQEWTRCRSASSKSHSKPDTLQQVPNILDDTILPASQPTLTDVIVHQEKPGNLATFFYFSWKRLWREMLNCGRNMVNCSDGRKSWIRKGIDWLRRGDRLGKQMLFTKIWCWQNIKMSQHTWFRRNWAKM